MAGLTQGRAERRLSLVVHPLPGRSAQLVWRPTSPIGASPTAPTSRSCAGSMTTLLMVISWSLPTAVSPAPSSSTCSPTPWEAWCPCVDVDDNGMVFTTRRPAPAARGSGNGFETLLHSLGRYFEAQLAEPSHDLRQAFPRADAGSPPTPSRPPSSSCKHCSTSSSTSTTSVARTAHSPSAPPPAAYLARPKANPAGTHQPHHRVPPRKAQPRQRLSLRVHGQLHDIGLGRHLHGTPIITPVADPRTSAFPRDHPPHHRPNQPQLPRHRTTHRRPTTTLRDP